MSDDPQAVLIDYTNHAGARQVREIRPIETGLHFGSSKWHPDEQWLLTAWDFGKQHDRTFALKDIHRWGVEPGRQMEIDLSIARQLQRSMERNARMVNRLKKLKDALSHIDNSTSAPTDLYAAIEPLESIIKDEEPTWPGA